MDKEFLTLDITNKEFQEGDGTNLSSKDNRDNKDIEKQSDTDLNNRTDLTEKADISSEYNDRISTSIFAKLNSAANRMQKESVEAIAILKDEIANLKKESYVLQKLPDQIEENLKLSIPEISKDIKVQCLKDLDNSMRACYDNMMKMDQMTMDIVKKIDDLKADKIKSFTINMAAIAVISVLTASASTYFMMQKFPPFVEIRSDSGVKIVNSTVKLLRTCLHILG